MSNDEWITPQWLIDAARKVMGGIDLDPASSETGQKIVCADHYYTKENSSLGVDWYGRVWLNPPYSRGTIDAFVYKALDEYFHTKVSQLCLLTNVSTATKWGQHLLLYSAQVCFLSPRVRFLGPDLTPGNSPRHDSLVAYFGPWVSDFQRVFSKHGVIK